MAKKKQKKKRIKVSDKGFNFEREMSKKLSLWWTNGNREDVIWRTSQSGGRATTRLKKGLTTKYQYGDLTFTDPIAQPLFDMFLIECKRGYSNDVDVLDCIDVPDNRETKPEIYEWWDKAQKEKEVGGRHEVLIILKRNRRLKVVFIRHGFLSILESYCGSCIGTKIIQVGQDIDILRLDNFLRLLTPETIGTILSDIREI